MDFTLPPEIDALRRRIRRFVDERLIPLERDPASYDPHENLALPLLGTLRAEARAERLWALGMPEARGGGGLPMTGLAACYEEMNRSIFGPVVFNAAAPDDGNMRVLEQVATEAQKERWLQPIVDGAVSSAFAMTEPDGCGSDPSLTYTTATRTGAGWRIDGRKHYITGAGDGPALYPDRPHLRRRAAGPLSLPVRRRPAPAGASCAASRSWGRRSMAAIASWPSTGWRSRTRTG